MESSGCGQCVDGFVGVVTYPSIYKGEAAIEKYYACACTTGRRRLTHTQGIEQILSATEMEERYPQGFVQHDARVIDLLTHANVPPACHSWTLQTYAHRFREMPQVDEVVKRADAWVKLPVSERSDWVMMGPNGTGKTGLAMALLRGSLDAGQSVQFWTVRHLSIVWRASYDAQLFERRENTPREIELLEQLTHPDVLVLDEFGGASLTDFVESTVTLIVDARQKVLKPTILTLNITDEDVKAGRKALNERVTSLLGPTLTDRLRERSQWLPLTGRSQRRAWKNGSSAA